jgi:post-segregation antitoxin (ccd killing protein)
MPTLTLKVSADLQRRLRRAARQQRLPVSELVRTAVEKELPREGKGWLLGSLQSHSVAPSSYDPSRPAFEVDDWDAVTR